MTDALRVLVVDDSETDAKLIALKLRRAGRLEYTRRVYDGATMRDALEAGRWDVVLCDSSMPGFGAAEALRLLADKDPTVPMIAVSGSVDPSAPEEAVRTGARAFVSKNRLEELLPTIERALRDALRPAK